MCRMLAYLGPPASLHDLLIAPPHSLVEQARAPRLQTYGEDNADGFGVCWYENGTLQLHRTTKPIWEDEDFRALASQIVTTACLAAVRSATPGLAIRTENTPPYVRGPEAFAHNGTVDGFVEDPAALRALVSEQNLGLLKGTTDSEVLFALVLDLLASGATHGRALQETARTVAGRCGGRLNLLLHDGAQLTGTAWGNSLFVAKREGVVIASEPFDGGTDWERVPDRSLVETTSNRLTITPIGEVEAIA